MLYPVSGQCETIAEPQTDLRCRNFPEHSTAHNPLRPISAFIRHHLLVIQLTNPVQFGALPGFLGVELPESVQPCHLKQLLRKEKRSDEVGLRTEK